MSKLDSGPAFPCETWQKGDGFNYRSGMTLRDYFAAKSIQGTLANSAFHDDHAGNLAKWAYEIADAMLAERDNP